MIPFLRQLFNVREQKKQLLFIILISFIVSFLIARFVSVYFGRSIHIYGYHIHHFYFGMLSLSIGGVLGLLSTRPKMLRIASGLIGIGIGLFADEIGLLLNCTTEARTCLYAFPDSFDFIIWISTAIFLIIMLTDYLERRAKRRA